VSVCVCVCVCVCVFSPRAHAPLTRLADRPSDRHSHGPRQGCRTPGLQDARLPVSPSNRQPLKEKKGAGLKPSSHSHDTN